MRFCDGQNHWTKEKPQLSIEKMQTALGNYNAFEDYLKTKIPQKPATIVIHKQTPAHLDVSLNIIKMEDELEHFDNVYEYKKPHLRTVKLDLKRSAQMMAGKEGMKMAQVAAGERARFAKIAHITTAVVISGFSLLGFGMYLLSTLDQFLI